MTPEEMKARTKAFAVRVVHVVESMPKGRVADVIGRQLMKCGTSVAANYRASCRAKSPADFIAKMGIVEEESDETIFWLELIMETKMLPSPRLLNLVGEAEEILAIVVASINTARGGRRRQREGNPQSAIRNPQSQRPND